MNDDEARRVVAFHHAAGAVAADLQDRGGNMSRCKSPQAAARLAERVAKDAEQRRKEKRRSWLMVAGVAMLSGGLMVADYFWLRYQARQRHEQRYHRGGKTNAPASAAPLDGQNQVTNHE